MPNPVTRRLRSLSSLLAVLATVLAGLGAVVATGGPAGADVVPDNGGAAFSAAHPSLALEDFEGSLAAPSSVKFCTP